MQYRRFQKICGLKAQDLGDGCVSFGYELSIFLHTIHFPEILNFSFQQIRSRKAVSSEAFYLLPLTFPIPDRYSVLHLRSSSNFLFS
jgi:hypothetical protein